MIRPGFNVTWNWPVRGDNVNTAETTMRKATLSVAMMLCIAGAVFAQPLTLSVKDGTVVINGKEVLPQELPEGLDLSGLNQTLKLTDTNARIIVEINGSFFGIENGRLVDTSEAGLHIFPGPRLDTDRLSHDRSEQLAAALMRQVADLKRVRSEADPNVREAIKTAEESVVQAARTVEMMPALHMQNYLRDLEQVDKDLFRRLVEESRMEMAAARLAAEIRSLPDGAERNRRLEELRGQMNVIFDYKLLNRRQEIQQLEHEVAALHLRVEKREAARKSLIERRLGELVGQ